MRRIYLLLGSLSLMVALFAILPFGVALASGGPGHYVGPKTYKGGIAPNTTCASAPSEANCTGQDPIAGGCQADAYTVPGGTAYVYNRSTLLAEVELRYSTRCQSNWSRTTYLRPGSEYISATVIRQTDYKDFGKNIIGTLVFSAMVYAPGTVKAEACGAVLATYSACTPFI